MGAIFLEKQTALSNVVRRVRLRKYGCHFSEKENSLGQRSQTCRAIRNSQMKAYRRAQSLKIISVSHPPVDNPYLMAHCHMGLGLGGVCVFQSYLLSKCFLCYLQKNNTGTTLDLAAVGNFAKEFLTATPLRRCHRLLMRSRSRSRSTSHTKGLATRLPIGPPRVDSSKGSVLAYRYI